MGEDSHFGNGKVGLKIASCNRTTIFGTRLGSLIIYIVNGCEQRVGVANLKKGVVDILKSLEVTDIEVSYESKSRHMLSL